VIEKEQRGGGGGGREVKGGEESEGRREEERGREGDREGEREGEREEERTKSRLKGGLSSNTPTETMVSGHIRVMIRGGALQRQGGLAWKGHGLFWQADPQVHWDIWNILQTSSGEFTDDVRGFV